MLACPQHTCMAYTALPHVVPGTRDSVIPSYELCCCLQDIILIPGIQDAVIP